MKNYEKKPVKLMGNKIRPSEISDIAIPEEKHIGIPVGNTHTHTHTHTRTHTQSALEDIFDE